MDLFLRFKSKRHSEAYSGTLELQLLKRSVMLATEAPVFGVISIISYALYPSVENLSSKMLVVCRSIAVILLFLGIYCLLRKVKKLKRFAYPINIALDTIMIFIAFSFYPVIGNLSINDFSKLGVFVWSWSACLFACAVNYVLINWWMKIAMIIAQMTYFSVFVGQAESYAVPIILFAVEGIFFYLTLTYFHEKYQRLDFLEKRKIYDNYEAIKKIFDDISQGIMIVDNKNQIVYSNQAVHRLFNEPQDQEPSLSLTNLLSKVRVKSMFPHLESSVTEQILPSPENEGECASILLNEFLEETKKALFDENPRYNSIVFETVHITEHKNTNLSIKFTKSLFMEKQVLVLNIIDQTDRDLLIAANASNEYKSRLLSSVSHELRTPLNGSINFIEQALSEPKIPNDMKEKWLVPALRSNQLLLSLVNDILDFSQMHAGKLRLVFESKNVVDTAKECIALLELQAKKKKLELELQNNLPLSEEILTTDHNRLKQIMLNLLSNAVKFTFEGSVSLILDPILSSAAFSPLPTQQLSPLADNGKLSVSSTSNCFRKGVRITVKDTGIGISSENQKKLFQAFEKLELGNKPLTINSTGAGLGLVISNHLVQRLNSKESTRQEYEVIKFFTEENVGSTFYFEVHNQEEKFRDVFETLNEKNDLSICSDPALGFLCLNELRREVSFKGSGLYKEMQDTLSPKIDTSAVPYSDLYKFKSSTVCKCSKILIVDDDTFNLTALDQILSKLSFTCDWALNGKEAVDKIKIRQLNRCSEACEQYKLVFLDCQMPILNGFETAKLLKRLMSDGKIDYLRIVGCSAFIQEADEKKARQAGMDDFCTKPINVKMIKDKIKANLE